MDSEKIIKVKRFQQVFQSFLFKLYSIEKIMDLKKTLSIAESV
jgi:hypothetical protein